MPAAVSYPGVYVQEQGSGARAVAAVPTANTLFIGMAEQGRMDVPVKVQTIAQFDREFGTSATGEMREQVVQFFLNGGATAYICRIAAGEANAAVVLESDTGAASLTVTARDAGLLGDMIRVEIDYATSDPERTFNMAVYRRSFKPDGTAQRTDEERYTGLSMNPASPDFVKARVNGISGLITVEPAAVAANPGLSIAGCVLPLADADIVTLFQNSVQGGAQSLRIAVADNAPVLVALTVPPPNPLPPGTTPSTIVAAWENDINLALAAKAIPDQVTVTVSGASLNAGGMVSGRLLRVACATGAVRITSASGGDVTGALLLGATAGIEGDAYGDARPAPTGLVARNGTSADQYRTYRNLLGNARNSLTGFTLQDDSGLADLTAPLLLGGADPLFDDGVHLGLDNARKVLDAIADVVNATAGLTSPQRWVAKRWGNRLAFAAQYGGDNSGVGAKLSTAGTNIAANGFPFATNVAARVPANVSAFTVGKPNGVAGTGAYQTGAVQGDNGVTPTIPDYAAMFAIVDRDVDIFNLMVLPRADGQGDAARKPLFAAASAFCERKRAFLLIDAPDAWKTIEAAEANIDTLRIGVETRNSAAYWPRLKIDNGTKAGRFIDPGGSIAGLMARTDANRGVWKAPAGLEATIRGVTGVERRMTDPDNGSINPKALNAVRVFPAGVVAWGARTLVGFDGSGNIDDKYIPVRRTMLFIEESLYRGLTFAVFEPNDEPLWAQVRLAAGSFMAGLFRQRAFAGRTARDAYFVACDATTTTIDDINLGIVNVIVGFAPLKPAEFVVLTVRQIAGQVQL